jgi:hypothetical protein
MHFEFFQGYGLRVKLVRLATGCMGGIGTTMLGGSGSWLIYYTNIERDIICYIFTSNFGFLVTFSLGDRGGGVRFSSRP